MEQFVAAVFRSRALLCVTRYIYVYLELRLEKWDVTRY